MKDFHNNFSPHFNVAQLALDTRSIVFAFRYLVERSVSLSYLGGSPLATDFAQLAPSWDYSEAKLTGCTTKRRIVATHLGIWPLSGDLCGRGVHILSLMWHRCTHFVPPSLTTRASRLTGPLASKVLASSQSPPNIVRFI